MTVSRAVLGLLLPALLFASSVGPAAADYRHRTTCDTQVEARKEVTTRSGILMTGVVYKCLRLNGRWVIKFQRANGLEVSDSRGRRLDRVPTSHEFVGGLESLIVDLRKDGKRIDELQLDMDAVGETWTEIGAGVRQAMLAGNGPLHNKDPQVTKALRRAIGQSGLVRDTCEMVRRHAMACVLGDGFTESVAFQPQYGSSDRKKMANSYGAALLPTQAIVIPFRDAAPSRKLTK